MSDFEKLLKTIKPVHIDWEKQRSNYQIEYQRAYRARKTRERQLAKLRQLIERYPLEAKEIIKDI